MRIQVKKTFIVAFAAVVALCASAEVITIPENGTLMMGGTAADTNNQRSNFIVFEPGSTLVVTQIGTSSSVWPTLIATNGAAYVECLDPTKTPTLQYNVFAYGSGSLTLRHMYDAQIGHADHYPIVDLGNVYKGDDLSGNILLVAGLSALAFPTNSSWSFTSSSTSTIRLYGEDMFHDDDVIELDRCSLMLCNPAAIPAGKTVRVKGNRFKISPLTVPDPAGDIVENINGNGVSKTSVVGGGCTYSCDVELVNNSTMTFTNSAAVTFNGSISGYNSKCGNIVLSGYKGTAAPVTLGGDNSGFTGNISAATDGTELVLSNANAAANATIDMSRPISVRGAEGVPAISIKAITGGTSGSDCTIRVASNQTVSVASVSGVLRISGAGAGAGSAVDIASLAHGAIIYEDGTVTVTYGGLPFPDGAVSGQCYAGSDKITIMRGDLGFEAAMNANTRALAFDVPDGTYVAYGTRAVTVRAGQGVEATLVPADGEVFSVAGEGSFAVESLLQRTVGWWFDFSRADTRFRIGEGVTNEFLDVKFADDQPYVERVVDWRHPDATNCLWNRRLYADGALQKAESVYPYLSAGSQNGLRYISMAQADNSSRRLPFSSGSGYNSVSSCAAQLVVMAFSGENGGGHAMVGTSEGAFGRDGTTIGYGITTNTEHDVWQNGVKVDPTTTKFKNGFQVLSVDMAGLHFNGLGFLQNIGINPNQMGGQAYGEVLIFTNAVNTQMRLEAELYLARKWGLESQYSADAVAQLKELRKANPVHIAAVGVEGTTINAGEHAVTVEGPFVGTVNLDGGALVVPDRPRPYSESDIPSAGRLYWADPDDAETVRRRNDPAFEGSNTQTCQNEVRAITDKTVRSLVEGQPLLYAVSNRRPTPILQARGFGPERMWLDFNDYAETSPLDGNCLRFVDCPALSTSSFTSGRYSTLASMPVRTAFIVQDSVRGGGSPLLGDVNGSGSLPPAKRYGSDWTQTIWPGDKPAEFVNGEARLNGETVDYRDGFLGQPEVFAIRGTGSVNAPVVGSYENSERGRKYGEIIGEILLYSTALSDGQVKGIEAYLMGKWIGRLPAGYADIRNATVTGNGTVSVAVGSQMPQIDKSFAGEVAVASGGNFEMTIETDTGDVRGALDCPAATLSLPASCTIALDFTDRPPMSMASRSYTLVDCASGASGVEWTFAPGANVPSRCKFLKDGNKISFRYFQPGFSVSFR